MPGAQATTVDDIMMEAGRVTTLPPIKTGTYTEGGYEKELVVKITDPEDPAVIVAYFNAESLATNNQGHVVDKQLMRDARRDLWDRVIVDPAPINLTGFHILVKDAEGNVVSRNTCTKGKLEEETERLQAKLEEGQTIETVDVMDRLSTRFHVDLTTKILKVLGVDSFFENLNTVASHPALAMALGRSSTASQGNTASPPPG